MGDRKANATACDGVRGLSLTLERRGEGLTHIQRAERERVVRIGCRAEVVDEHSSKQVEQLQACGNPIHTNGSDGIKRSGQPKS